MKCKICTSETALFAQKNILQKHLISYFRCICCGFIQTEEPYWLNEAYSHAINRTDVGLVARNIYLSKITKCIIFAFFNRKASYIDYGGGYGLFVRLMRDNGLDFYHYDKYCANILAQGFDATTSVQKNYELLTAFEVFEHLLNPLDEIDKMLHLSENILFTTELVPKNNPEPSEWWYYGLEHGQHISFYTLKTLKVIAEKFRMNIYSSGSVHLLSQHKLNKHLFALLAKRKVASVISPLMIKKSLIQNDFTMLTS